MAFPPVPVFPNDIDSDYTLFLVHNTTETRLCLDNSAWAEEINIVPVSADRPEIWADNGFGNIEGELFYYDSVEKNGNGKVVKLKGCARNLGGKKTKFNPKGTWVRSYVVAEHHNQLVDAILNVEEFVGYNFDPRRETLDWRIRNLRELATIFDDFDCPDVNLTFNIIENNPETGILAQYAVEITPPGSINNFRLDFGDGNFTTTELSGTHRYALNAAIDPIVTVSNDKCQSIQSSVERDNPAEPPTIITQVFDIPIPEVPSVPDFTVVPVEVPEPEINLPPIVFPCISLEGQIGPLPSVIIGPDIQLVSTVEIIGPDNPINITQSVVTIEGGFELPSIIFVDVPPTIVIDPPIPPTIVVVTSAANSLAMQMDWSNMPNLTVDWGPPPDLTVQMAFAKQAVFKPLAATDGVQNEFGDEFNDLFDNQMTVEYETVGLPSEIKILAPDLPDLKIDASDVPRSIKVQVEEATFPKEFKLVPDATLMEGIKLVGDITDEIRLVGVEAIPHKIEVEMVKEIPSVIRVEMVKPIPDEIWVKGIPDSIDVNMPTSIEVVVPEGVGIPLLLPEEMPKMELVYNGAPLEMKITMDKMIVSDEQGKTNCVMITPCPR